MLAGRQAVDRPCRRRPAGEAGRPWTWTATVAGRGVGRTWRMAVWELLCNRRTEGGWDKNLQRRAGGGWSSPPHFPNLMLSFSQARPPSFTSPFPFPHGATMPCIPSLSPLGQHPFTTLGPLPCKLPETASRAGIPHAFPPNCAPKDLQRFSLSPLILPSLSFQIALSLSIYIYISFF